MSVLTEDIIIQAILPHLPIDKRGKKLPTSKWSGIVQLIFYRRKTGCQWRELPIKQFLDHPYSWQSVFHHLNRWSKLGAWQSVWEHPLRTHPRLLDLSSVQLDGTHTLSKQGGQAVGYQSRKSSNTSNMRCISDRNGVLLAASQPEKGNHHDSFQAQVHFKELMEMLTNATISTDGLFLNADAGFDTKAFRSLCYQHNIIPNFCFNKRNGKTHDREDYFDPELYKHRTVIERAFAWMDAYKALLIRFETSARNWFNLNLLGFIARFSKKLNKQC